MFRVCIEIQIFQINSMEKLNRLIQDASNQFQCHNFQTALDLYLRCIEQCEKSHLPSYVKNNLKSSEAALRIILGQLDEALKACNSVLENEKLHYLCLLRRSQIYKKQNKLKKAMKDLQTIGLYAPDNMQIAALKLELKTLMIKVEEFSSSESEPEEEVDEEELLKFTNLKKIDRTSVSIMIPKGRQSRVTISGDSAFLYDSQDTKDRRQSFYYAPKFICQRFIDIDEELENFEKNEEQTEQIEAPIITIKPSRQKSILRNRQSELFIVDNNQPKSKGIDLIKKLQNVDGKVISSNNSVSIEEGQDQKEVEFKKSLFNESIQKSELLDPTKETMTAKSKKGPRRSCLKRSSFNVLPIQLEKKGRRSSKFDELSKSSIDGKIIKSNQKRKQALKEASKENIGGPNSDDQSDNGSFNIFGSRQIEISKELRQNLGIQIIQSNDLVDEDESKVERRSSRKKSILKKSSLIIPNNKKSSIFRQEVEAQSDSRANQPTVTPIINKKKSVMFMTH